MVLDAHGLAVRGSTPALCRLPSAPLPSHSVPPPDCAALRKLPTEEPAQSIGGSPEPDRSGEPEFRVALDERVLRGCLVAVEELLQPALLGVGQGAHELLDLGVGASESNGRRLDLGVPMDLELGGGDAARLMRRGVLT